MTSEDKYIEDIDVHDTAADPWKFSLKGCEIDAKLSLDEVMKIIEQNNGYHTVRVKLSDEMVDKMKKLEERINAILESLICNFAIDDEVKLVHGNVVFAETCVSTVYPKTLIVTDECIGREIAPPFVKLWIQ